MSRVVGRVDGRDVFQEVEKANDRETLWVSGRDLVIELGTMLPLDHGRVEWAVQGQVSMARKRAKHGFIAEVRKYGHQILSDAFIQRVLAGPQKQRGIPGASLTPRRSRSRSKLLGLRPAPPPPIPTAQDFPALPVGSGSMRVRFKLEPQVEVTNHNPAPLGYIVLPETPGLGGLKVEPEERSGIGDPLWATSCAGGDEVRICGYTTSASGLPCVASEVGGVRGRGWL
ncbi:hypothetical protein DPMN_125922 [Dreissena polymorpha]|uniref:Uncharacterized protein n=1 Tax=Dreissena polymorpha TaxID=45954 RepID=A0A9D4GV82_DREPO|nr:hypothetical protein DPMN_125922 [Dreissena polymorpha]